MSAILFDLEDKIRVWIHNRIQDVGLEEKGESLGEQTRFTPKPEPEKLHIERIQEQGQPPAQPPSSEPQPPSVIQVEQRPAFSPMRERAHPPERFLR